MQANDAMEALTAFIAKGPLWTHSLTEVEKVRKEIFALDNSSQAISMLHPLMMEAIEAGKRYSDAYKEYQRAFDDARRKILAAPEYASLHTRWSNHHVNTLKRRFAAEIPPDVIDDLLAHLRIKQNVQFDWFEPIDLAHFKGLENRFREAVKVIPLGLNFQENVWDLIKTFYDEQEYTYCLLRANSIEDLLDDSNPFNMPNVGSEVRGHIHSFFRWLGKSDRPTIHDKFYAGWYTLTMRLFHVSEDWVGLLTQSLPCPPDLDTEKSAEPVVEISASILAAMLTIGIPDHMAQELCIPILYGLLKECYPIPKTSGDLFIRKWLWGVAGWAHSPSGIMSHLSFALGKVVDWVDRTLLPVGFIQSCSNALAAMGISVYLLLDRLFELIFVGIADYTNVSYLAASEYFYASRSLISGLLPESRRRPKTVWALLFTSNFTTLTPAEKFALGCNMMKPPLETPNYYKWASDRLTLLRQYGADLAQEPSIPIRGFRLPKEPTVADEELAHLAPLMPDELNIHTTATNFVHRLHKMGVPPGIDGTWFATNDRIAKSINRYNVDVVPIDDQVRTRALRSAHALADRFPSMYRDAKFLTPAAAINKVKVKYSPGLPFIPDIRDRKELKRLGVFDAMVRLAERYLLEGEHPGSMAHCFVKSDIINLQKLLNGKNIRTIVAADLLSSVIQYCSSVEVTRRQPPIDAFVMNAVPRTEGGFRPFYDALSKMKSVIMADATEFDSKLPPVISVDALAELRSLGYDGQLIKPILESQNWATYIALRFAGLINLATGDQLPHTQGLMTGQGNTGVDNRDAFRLIILTAWSIVTNRDPSEFWEDNVIGNAGDDDAIGTNQPEVWPQVIEYIQNQFGMVITIEAEGFENLALVGLRPIPVPNKSIIYYNVLGHPVPSYSIAGDRMALLAKRTEYRVRVAGFKDIAFLMKHIEGIIGSAYLTAHLFDVYTQLTDEYKIEVSQIMLRFYKSVSFLDEYDAEGDIVGTLLELGSERERYVGKTHNIRLWLKSHRWPTYKKIMEIALKPQDVASTKMAKDHSKILTWNPSIPFAEKVLYGIIKVREGLVRGIPNHVARSLPEFKGLDPTFLMRNPNYPIAKFVWLSLYHKNHGKVPRSQLFLSVLKENPYGSAEDGLGFLNWLSNENNLSVLAEENLEEYRAQMVFLTVVYWYVESIFNAARNVPILSIAFNLYALTMRDVNRLYSFLNYIYFIATGRSSPIISNMMPPDPYAWVKQFATICSNLIPKRVLFYCMPGLKWIVGVLPMMVELWAAGDAMVLQRPYRTAFDLIDIPAPWEDLVGNLRQWLLSDLAGEPRLVVAATGTGKSTAFIGAIVRAGFSKTIWLLCPTIVARDAYDNPFLLDGLIQVLQRGVINAPEKRVKVLTYGHGIIRMPSELDPSDLIIFDEQHLGEMDMWRAWLKFPNFKRISITATPVAGRMPTIEHRLNYPGGRRFATKVTKTNLNFADLISVLATEKPHLLTRALVVCPTIAQVNVAIKTLERLSLTAHALTSLEPDVVPHGIIVASTIADTAVTILPHPTCLIDFGLTLQLKYDFSGFWLTTTPEIVPTGQSAYTQRLGRVGRGGDSEAFVMAPAGTGVEPEPRVTAFGLLFDQSLADGMLSAYGKICPVKARSNEPGLLRYITMAPDIQATYGNLNSLALAMFIWTLGSDHQTLETIQHTWLDLRVARSEYEIINIIVDDLRNANYGDPLLGVWTEAVDLLNAGCFGVYVGTDFQHCTGLCVNGSYVSPIGRDPSLLTFSIPATDLPGALHPSSLNTWRSKESYMRSSHNFENLIPPHDIVAVRILPDRVVRELEADIVSHSFYEIGRMVVAMVTARFCTSRSKVIIMRDKSHVPFEPGPGNIKVEVAGEPSWYSPNRLDLTMYPLPGEITSLSLAMIIAAGLEDHMVLYWGNRHPPLMQLARDNENHGFIVSQDRCTALISPRYARKWVNHLINLAVIGLPEQGVNEVPKRVLLNNALERPEKAQVDVLVWLSEDGKIMAL